jgi:hypothetical protein
MFESPSSTYRGHALDGLSLTALLWDLLHGET